MLTYIVTWTLVFIFSGMARKTDHNPAKELSSSRVEHTKSASFFLTICGIVLIFVAGCRYYIGGDFYSYYGWYKDIGDTFFERLISFNEPVMSFIYWVILHFCDDGFPCVFVTNAVMITLVLATLKNNTDKTDLAFILYSLICWVATFNGMRQALAAAVVFSGYPLLRDKKYRKFALLCFLAFLCHKSAAVFILLCFIVHRKVTGKYILTVLSVSVVVIISYSQVFHFTNWLLDKNLNTSGAYIARSVNIFRILANTAPAVFFCVSYWKKTRTELEDFYLNLLIVNGAVSLATLNSAYLARLCIYTAPFEVIGICELVKGKKRQNLIQFIIVFFYLLFELYQVYSHSELSPFKWIWSRNTTY